MALVVALAWPELSFLNIDFHRNQVDCRCACARDGGAPLKRLGQEPGDPALVPGRPGGEPSAETRSPAGEAGPISYGSAVRLVA